MLVAVNTLVSLDRGLAQWLFLVAAFLSGLAAIALLLYARPTFAWVAPAVLCLISLGLMWGV